MEKILQNISDFGLFLLSVVSTLFIFILYTLKWIIERTLKSHEEEFNSNRVEHKEFFNKLSELNSELQNLKGELKGRNKK